MPCELAQIMSNPQQARARSEDLQGKTCLWDNLGGAGENVASVYVGGGK